MIAASAYRLVRLLRNQWLAADKLAAIQRDKLNALVSHAYRNVPYYRQLFDRSGIEPEDIREPGDLARLPVTTKEELLRHEPQARMARDLLSHDTLTLRTSGSQGMPFEVSMRPEDHRWWGLLAMRGWLANHYRFGYKTLIVTESRAAPHSPRWFEGLGLYRKRYVSNHDALARKSHRWDGNRPRSSA